MTLHLQKSPLGQSGVCVRQRLNSGRAVLGLGRFSFTGCLQLLIKWKQDAYTLHF